jgi:hypothetical protein
MSNQARKAPLSSIEIAIDEPPTSNPCPNGHTKRMTDSAGGAQPPLSQCHRMTIVVDGHR